MKDNRYEKRYNKARSKVDRLRRFYMHATVYVVVNLIVSGMKIGRNLRNGESFNEAFFDTSHYLLWIFWGIGLALHAFSVFGLPFLLGRNWEEDKIEDYMKRDQQDNWN